MIALVCCYGRTQRDRVLKKKKKRDFIPNISVCVVCLKMGSAANTYSIKVNNELESTRKEAATAQSRVVQWHLPGQTEVNHKNPDSV
jgi:hypothetical protein